MKADLAMKKPCGNCPFMKEGAIQLNPGCIESICDGLYKNDRHLFLCHKTTYGAKKIPSACMGALAWANQHGRFPVSVRFALAAGMLGIETLDALADKVIDYKPEKA